MPILESRKEEIVAALHNETDYEKIAESSAELERITAELDEIEMRWLELQE